MMRILLRTFTLVMLASWVRADERPVIYQLFVRHFGNTNETRKIHGTLEENGCGRFADINDAALASLKDLGVTHLWLTGVLQQATRTDHSAVGQPADDPDICKGLAGSPYAIKDYFDVCPDYATGPARRLDEFRDLVRRCHDHGFRVLIDFVPNHVSRAYDSDIRPDLSFGTRDRRDVFFHPANSFFYLQMGEPPLRLPTDGQPGCDGLFGPETEFGRVTGNNVASWTPGRDDWYETVKLNYGWNYLDGRPDEGWSERAKADPPETWRIMDAVLAHWQGMGVDGFRCDMAHMVPMAFWQWAIDKARQRDADAVFIAEAYDNDPAKLTDGNVMDDLLAAGFTAVYDDPAYDLVKDIYDGNRWANDLAALIDNGGRFHRSLRYAENHDEVRLASPDHWSGEGFKAGPAVSALLFALGRGPVMIYNGQEVGECAIGAEGHGGDDARTSLFDYGSLPALVPWVNGHRYDGARLDSRQTELRSSYRALLQAVRHPVFASGETVFLNPLNAGNPRFGRLPGETAGGHWLCALERRAPDGGTLVVIINLHPTRSLPNTRIQLSRDVGSAVTSVLALPETDAGWTQPADDVLEMDLPPASIRILHHE